MIPEELIQSEDFGRRDGQLAKLKKEIRNNMERKQTLETDTLDDDRIADNAIPKESSEDSKIISHVLHEKYGYGSVINEDEDNITVIFEAYGEKTFSKLFCPMKYV
jgi:hypothetical protein